jgi:hypothetical protein
VSLSAPDTPDMVARLLSTSACVVHATHRHLSTNAVSASARGPAAHGINEQATTRLGEPTGYRVIGPAFPAEAGSANDTTSSSLCAVT